MRGASSADPDAAMDYAGRLAAQASSPVEDQRGPVDYKRHLADELTRRVLRRALDRVGATAPAA